MNIVLSILFNLVLGILPECAFLFVIVKFTKNVKSKKIALFILMSLAQIAILALFLRSVWATALCPILIFAIFKALYRENAHIVDTFLFIIPLLYLMIIAIVCYQTIPGYWIAYSIDRIILIFTAALIIIYRKRLNAKYKLICQLWNRRDDGRVKALTVRNIAVSIIFAILIVAMYGLNNLYVR